MATGTALDFIPGYEGSTATALDFLPGGAGGLFSGLFGGGQDQGYQDIQNQLAGIPEEMKPYYQPYIQAGTESLGGLQQQLGQMTQDPGALMNMLGAGYQQSPGLKFSEHEALINANRAGAASGQLGSPSEQAALARQVYGLGQQDYGDYMNRALGLYGGGVQGLQGLTSMGAQSGQSLAENIARARESQAGLSQAQMQSEAEQQSGLMGGLGSLAGMALMAL